MKNQFYSLIFLFISTSLSISAADILVNSSALPGSYLKLSDAVNAASAGDRILVSPQTLPYQEINDTLFIDKDLTILPYVENSFVQYSGTIMLTLDNINEFTLIGFRTDYGTSNLSSQINDSLSNVYSIINVIDCKLESIRLDQPKTSLYLSYSYIMEYVAFAHGNIIANYIYNLIFGLYDYGYNGASGATSSAGQVLELIHNNGYNQQIFGNEPYYFWPIKSYQFSTGSWYLNNSNIYNNHSPLNSSLSNNSCEFITECELFENSVSFGNANVYSDTCLVIANKFPLQESNINLFSTDFPIHFFNNEGENQSTRINIWMLCPSSKGSNRIINNDGLNPTFMPAFCSTDSSYNFSDVYLEIQNNKHILYAHMLPPRNPSVSYYRNLSISTKGIMAYNYYNDFYTKNETVGLDTSLFSFGPAAYNNYIGSPSLEFLNLDLTPNIIGIDGGSHASSNYGYNVGKMPSGSKARITYLNLPTQIFNPSNIRIKSNSIHGNND